MQQSNLIHQVDKFQFEKKSHLLSVYSPHQLSAMNATLLIRGKETDLQTRLDILMGHFMLLRSQNQLEAQLADVYMRPQYMEGAGLQTSRASSALGSGCSV